jgi:hypothetical protein
MWNSFGKPKQVQGRRGRSPSTCLAWSAQFLKAGGFSLEIELATDGTKKAETEFRRKLKEFTSGAKPHHCLVQAIDIESPAPILDEGCTAH